MSRPCRWSVALVAAAVAVCSTADVLAAQRPTLTATRELLLSGAELDFVSIALMVIDGRGRLHVWQDDDARIRRFDADGTERSPLGRAGEGPGEFRMRSVGGMVGDTFWVSDPMLRRTTFFTGDGSLLRTQRWPTSVIHGAEHFAGGIGVQPIVVESSGTQIVQFGRGTRVDLPTWWQPASAARVILRVDSEGNFRQLLASFPETSSACVQTFQAPGRNPGTIQVPFCHTTYRRVVPEVGGSYSAGPQDGSGGEGHYVVSARGFDGTTIYSVVLRLPSERISRSAVDSARAALLNQPRPPGLKEHIERAFNSIRMPTTYPPVAGLFVGRDGTAWIEMRTTKDERDWLVISPSGTERGTVRLPSSFRVFAADANRLWGTVRDQDDIPSVVRYRVQ